MRKKIFGDTKSSKGAPKTYKERKKPIRKTEKKVATFFLETVKIVYFIGAPKISAGGRRMVNMVIVTSLCETRIQ